MCSHQRLCCFTNLPLEKRLLGTNGRFFFLARHILSSVPNRSDLEAPQGLDLNWCFGDPFHFRGSNRNPNHRDPNQYLKHIFFMEKNIPSPRVSFFVGPVKRCLGDTWNLGTLFPFPSQNLTAWKCGVRRLHESLRQ